MKIVILDGHVANPGDLSWGGLTTLGEVDIYARTSPEDVIERCKNAEAIFVNKVVISESVMAQLPLLKFVGVLATGYNNVDTLAARKRGITVCNVPAYSTASVAQLVFAMILHLTNRVALYSESVSNGDWTRCPDFSYSLGPLDELDGMTLGVYGFGNIGRRVAAIAHAFGMNIISPTSQSVENLPEYVKKVSFDEMLSNSDIVTIHSPLTATNRHLFNTDNIGKMRRGAILVNTARGPIVDEQALADALRTGHVRAAAIDVLEQEPPKDDCPLLAEDLVGGNNPRCVITPHIAWQSVAARKRLLSVSASNLQAFIDGKPINVVN